MVVSLFVFVCVCLFFIRTKVCIEKAENFQLDFEQLMQSIVSANGSNIIWCRLS